MFEAGIVGTDCLCVSKAETSLEIDKLLDIEYIKNKLIKEILG